MNRSNLSARSDLILSPGGEKVRMRGAAPPNSWDAFGAIESPSPQSSPIRARKPGFPSPGWDCRFSPKRGFDKLSLSGWGVVFKGLFPLTLSSSKGLFPLIDSLGWERDRVRGKRRAAQPNKSDAFGAIDSPLTSILPSGRGSWSPDSRCAVLRWNQKADS